MGGKGARIPRTLPPHAAAAQAVTAATHAPAAAKEGCWRRRNGAGQAVSDRPFGEARLAGRPCRQLAPPNCSWEAAGVGSCRLRRRECTGRSTTPANVSCTDAPLPPLHANPHARAQPTPTQEGSYREAGADRQAGPHQQGAQQEGRRRPWGPSVACNACFGLRGSSMQGGRDPKAHPTALPNPAGTPPAPRAQDCGLNERLRGRSPRGAAPCRAAGVLWHACSRERSGGPRPSRYPLLSSRPPVGLRLLKADPHFSLLLGGEGGGGGGSSVA